jgi:hypothetical protein
MMAPEESSDCWSDLMIFPGKSFQSSTPEAHQKMTSLRQWLAASSDLSIANRSRVIAPFE